ncbi:hypothetical protein [Ralstonia sp.]|uniref:hypothetical protein n=1 Tax=Ralstonia sp. TaxID=54061 RepID=UPI00257D2D1E|nr:hypothetical protein [Ralstonia sp.]MBA4282021.1 hypothetical protein [Ralstonia sp.]
MTEPMPPNTLAADAAQAQQGVTQLVADLNELREFLRGAGPLNDMHFGEKKVMPYWWRAYLTRMVDAGAALTALSEQVAELTKERDEALSAARQQDKLREATLATLRGVSADLEAAEAKVARFRRVLEGVKGAIETGRSEPLFIWRDQINIALDDAALTEGTPE